MTIRFSEPVVGFALGDLALTRDGGPNLLGGGETLTSTDGITWSLGNLTGLTTPTGSYQLTLDAAGASVADLAANPLTQGSSISFAVDTTPPVASILAVTPDPRNTAVVSMTILFSEPVTGVDLSDLRLTRDGAPISLSGASLSGGAARYVLGGLAGLTQPSGDYQLTLTASGSAISDQVGNAPAADATRQFTVDTTAPAAQIDPVAPNPRTSGVETLTIRFSEPIAGLDLGDLALVRDGSPIDLSGATLNGDPGNRVWDLGGLGGLTWMTGHYTLTLTAAGSGIVDQLANPLAADAQASFHFSHVLVHLPLVVGEPLGPDLVASVRLAPDQRRFRGDEPVMITVVVTNQGDLPATPFWVDLMLNPQPIPTGPALWNNTCTLSPCRGLSWFVGRSLAPGETIVLTSTPGSYSAADSLWSEYLLPGTGSIYVVVDSWNGAVPDGAVRESDEANNIVAITGLVVSPAGASATSTQGLRPAVVRARPIP